MLVLKNGAPQTGQAREMNSEFNVIFQVLHFPALLFSVFVLFLVRHFQVLQIQRPRSIYKTFKVN